MLFGRIDKLGIEKANLRKKILLQINFAVTMYLSGPPAIGASKG